MQTIADLLIPLDRSPDAARRGFLGRLRSARRRDDRWMEGTVLYSLGVLDLSVGDRDDGRDYLEQALDIARELGDDYGEETILDTLRRVAEDPFFRP